MSRSVRGCATSCAFSETLGAEVADDLSDKRRMFLRDGPTALSGFGGLIETDRLAFSPGPSQDAQPVGGALEALRAIMVRPQAAGHTRDQDCGTGGSAPARFVTRGPDGNPILTSGHISMR
ncbi:hypothetical protein [Jannaschia seohaensis]|nr:hypothetical protein [Jannaschia seohaensis]